MVKLRQINLRTLSSYRCAIILISVQLVFMFYIQYVLQCFVSENKTNDQGTNCEHQDAVDVVFTWVNGSEERFLEQLHRFSKGMTVENDVNSDQRFAEKSELKYALRSIDKNMPWIRHVWIVTNGQVPNWLNLDNGYATVITHEEIFPNKSFLPTFSSPGIEANIFRIPGLSDRFLYFNDDWMVGAPVDYATFYTPIDGIKFYWEYAMPPCAHRCPWKKVNDGHCDYNCYLPECQMDGNDCGSPPEPPMFGKIRRPLTETMYSSSLQVTHRLFNRHFGMAPRKVMPHMPILVDKNAMIDSWMDFPEELMNTTSHRFRDLYDMQFEFFHTFYVHHKTKNVSLDVVLQQEDVNQNGYLDNDEIKTLLSKLHNGLPNLEQETQFLSLLNECLISFKNNELPKFKTSLLARCERLHEELKDSLMKQPKYKHLLIPMIQGDDFYEFSLLKSDLEQVSKQLNDLCRHPRKFICINDDLTHTASMAKVNQDIRKELTKFYQSMFPFPSKYELPAGKTNNISYIQNWKQFKGTINNVSSTSADYTKPCVLLLLISTIMICFYLFYTRSSINSKSRLVSYQIVSKI